NAVHGVLEELIGYADEAVDGAVGGVDRARTGRSSLCRPALAVDDSHCRRWDRLVAAGYLEQIELVDLLHGAALTGYECVQIPIVVLALFVVQIIASEVDDDLILAWVMVS